MLQKLKKQSAKERLWKKQTRDLETQTDANESVEKIETVEETTKEETIETNGKNGNPSDNKNEKNGFNFGKIIVPGFNNYNFGCFCRCCLLSEKSRT